VTHRRPTQPAVVRANAIPFFDLFGECKAQTNTPPRRQRAVDGDSTLSRFEQARARRERKKAKAPQ
jgi:hypothetical protein